MTKNKCSLKLLYLSKTNKNHSFEPSIASLYKSLKRFHSSLYLNENSNIKCYKDQQAIDLLDLHKYSKWEKWRQKWHLKLIQS